MPGEVAVIGAGVMGLTSAIELARAGHHVTIFARERPRDTTSAVPAAIWFPYHALPEANVNRWALATRERLRELVDDPASGVRWVSFSRMWIDAPPPVPAWAQPEEITWLRPEELDPRFRFGYRISVPLMENPTYMRYLETTFTKEIGGEIREADFQAIADVPERYGVIVNCSGYGAKALCSDPELQPGRGVIVVTATRSPECHVVWDEYPDSLMYVLSRSGDCVLGGCDETSDLLAISRAEAEAIIRRCAPDGGDAVTLKDARVGIRPIREAGVRVEAEHVGGRLVVHNYGHGGAGFTLSWGCAEEVVRLTR